MKSECKGYGVNGTVCTTTFEDTDREGLISQEISHYLAPENIATTHGYSNTVHMHREFLEEGKTKRVYDHGESGTFTTSVLEEESQQFTRVREDLIVAYK